MLDITIRNNDGTRNMQIRDNIESFYIDPAGNRTSELATHEYQATRPRRTSNNFTIYYVWPTLIYLRVIL